MPTSSKYAPLSLYVGISVFLLWGGSTYFFPIPEYIFPSPLSVFFAFVENFKTLVLNTLITALEALTGFILATVIAGLVAIIFCQSETTEEAFMPYFVALKSIPIIALVPLIIMWLGNGFWAKATMSAMISFFPIVVNWTNGLRMPDKDKTELDLMRTFAATNFQIFFYLRLPRSLPFLFSAFKIAIVLSVVGAIVAEFTSANKGIGYVILVSALRSETPLLFCGIILSTLIGLFFYYFVDYLERKCWHSKIIS